MKITYLFILLLNCIVSFSQIPSINETSDEVSMRYKKNKPLNYKKIKKEIDSIEKIKAKIFTIDTLKLNKIAIGKLVEQFVSETEKIDNLNNQIEIDKNKKLSEKEIYLNYFDDQTLKINAEIDEISTRQKRLNNSLDKIDKCALDIRNKKIELKNLIIQRNDKLKSLTYSAFMPTLNKEYRDDFFSLTYNNNTAKTNYVNSLAILGNENGYLVQSEILTDNLNVFRVSFGTVINAKTSKKEDAPATETEALVGDEKSKDAINRLVNGGGNLYFDVILPLVTTYDGSASDYLTFYTYFNTRAAMDVKGYGNNIDTSTGNGSFGFNSYGSISSDTKKFNFFIQASINYNFGSNDFYKNLGLKDQQGFLNGKIIAGVGILNHFRVTAIINTFGSDEKLRNGKVNIGIQVLPGF